MVDIILWANSRILGLDEMTDITYRLLNSLKAYGEELEQKYQKVLIKMLAYEEEFTRDRVREIVEEGISDYFLEWHGLLNSSIGLFSSLEDSKSSGFSIYLGNTGTKLINTCIISLPRRFSGTTSRKDDFVLLLKQLIEIFDPFYAFVPDNKNKPHDMQYRIDKKPTSVHWLNYYDKDTAKAIGRLKLLTAGGVERFHDGYFLRMQDDPIDIHNPAHLALQTKWNKKLGLVGSKVKMIAER